MEEILVVVRYGLLPPANEVWGKVISLQACVCPQEREYLTRYTHPPPPPEEQTQSPQEQTPPRDQVHPPGPGTPPGAHPPGPDTPPTQDQVNPPPETRYTLQDQVHPPDQVHPLWDQVHPPGPGTPPRPGTPPSGTRYIPQDQVHPPPDQVHPPGTRYTPLQSMLGDMVNARAVRILLECNLVHTKRLWLLRRRLYFGVLSRHTIMCENTFLVIYLFISISAFDKMSHLSFEKDDDSNGHIDFITAASVRCDQCQTC